MANETMRAGLFQLLLLLAVLCQNDMGEVCRADFGLGFLIASMIIAAASATAQGVAQHQQAKAEAKDQARVAEANARAAELEGKAAEETALANARREQVNKRRALAHARALYGASGAALDSGSPLATLGQMAADLQLSADDAAVGGGTARASALSQAGLYRMQGQTALNSLKGYKTLIGINAGSAALSAGIGAYAAGGGLGSAKASAPDSYANSYSLDGGAARQRMNAVSRIA